MVILVGVEKKCSTFNKHKQISKRKTTQHTRNEIGFSKLCKEHLIKTGGN